MSIRVLLLTLLSLFISITAADAQQKPSLHIVVEDLDEVARKCGVTADILRAPVVLTLRNNRIDDETKITFPYLYINANILFIEASRSCVYSINVSIRDWESATKRGSFRAVSQYQQIILCSKNGIGIAAQSRLTKIISDTVEQQLKLCLAEVTY